MKKVFIAAAAVAMFSLASCKKDYTCKCTVSGQGIDLPLNDYKKGDAEDACSAAETT